MRQSIINCLDSRINIWLYGIINRSSFNILGLCYDMCRSVRNSSFTKTLKLNSLVFVVFKGTRAICWVLLFPLVLSDFNTLYGRRIKLHFKLSTLIT